MSMMSDQPPDEEGADLAAQFFKALSDRNISLDDDDDDDDDDDEEDGEETESNNNDETGLFEEDDADDAILREYDVPSTEEGMTELTDTQIYDEMKDRVLESAGAFVELASVSMVGVGDDDENDGVLGLATGGGGLGDEEEEGNGMYRPPMIVPDSGLTAGEVVELGEWIYIYSSTTSLFLNTVSSSLIHTYYFSPLHASYSPGRVAQQRQPSTRLRR